VGTAALGCPRRAAMPVWNARVERTLLSVAVPLILLLLVILTLTPTLRGRNDNAGVPPSRFLCKK